MRIWWSRESVGDRGKFGTVYQCREKGTDLRLAAKFVQATKKADRFNVEREVEIMKSLRHPRLIQLYDAYDDGKKEICLLLELYTSLYFQNTRFHPIGPYLDDSS